MSFDDRDVHAALGALVMSAATKEVRVDDAGFLVGAEYNGDIDDNVDRLIKRGLLEPATTVDREGSPLREFDTPHVVRLTESGWYELWRR